MPKNDKNLTMRTDADFLKRIDKWRNSLHPIAPSRSDAIRYLVDLGIKTAEELSKTPNGFTKK